MTGKIKSNELIDAKKIKGFENYSIDINGNIMHIKNGIKIPTIGSTGYYMVDLWQNNKRKRLRVHRILYETFIDKIPEGMFINHIDGNKLNNSLYNLEICTNRYNLQCQNKRHNNKNGYSNIYYCEERNNYYAQFQIGGKTKSLGPFNTLKEAIANRDSYMIEITKKY